MQLAAYGAQDIYLTGNPQITFFKFVYRRHTNFSMETIEQSFDGTVGFEKEVSCILKRKADLVHKMYLKFNIHTTNIIYHDSGMCANLGSAIIDQIDLEIGGQLIDRHYGHWLEVYANLTEPHNGTSRARVTYPKNNSGDLIQGSKFQNMSWMGGVEGYRLIAGTTTPYAYVPFRFWFCRHPGLALPLIALQYHEVKVRVKFQKETYCLVDGSGSNTESAGTITLNANLMANYIFLDTDERRRFAQEKHEYLIEQLQFIDSSLYDSTGSNNISRHPLYFNHPVKELIWTGGVTLQNVKTVKKGDEWINGTTGGSSSTRNGHERGPSTPATDASGSMSASGLKDTTYKLEINGNDLFEARKRDYFTRAQIWMYHSGSGGLDCDHDVNSQTGDSIAVYSFALKPQEYQPSGTCNFSRIKNSYLVMGTAGPLYIYAVNYNILRIMSGMAGLVYTN